MKSLISCFRMNSQVAPPLKHCLYFNERWKSEEDFTLEALVEILSYRVDGALAIYDGDFAIYDEGHMSVSYQNETIRALNWYEVKMVNVYFPYFHNKLVSFHKKGLYK